MPRGFTFTGWWACDDGDEFPSRQHAVDHVRMVYVGERDSTVKIRPIYHGPPETVEVYGDASVAENQPGASS